MGEEPVQVPLAAVSVCPASGVPEIVGATVFAGASAWTGLVAADVATAAAPPGRLAFEAVTRTIVVVPTSDEVSGGPSGDDGYAQTKITTTTRSRMARM